jgi:hypothetical protein
LRRLSLLFLPEGLKLQFPDTARKLSNASSCLDGADNKPDGEEKRNSKNQNDDEHPFHKVCFSGSVRLVPCSVRLDLLLTQVRKEPFDPCRIFGRREVLPGPSRVHGQILALARTPGVIEKHSRKAKKNDDA